MRGVIKLTNEKPEAVPFDHFCHCLCPSHILLVNKLILVCLCRAFFTTYLLAFFLSVTLQLAEVAVFPISIHVVAWLGMVACFWWTHLVQFWSASLAVLLALECGNIIFLSFGLISSVHSKHFPKVSLPLLCGGHIIHLFQHDSSVLLLCHYIVEFVGKSCPE